MSRQCSLVIDYSRDSPGTLLQATWNSFFLTASERSISDLCRDARSWRRASDEISWGNNNTKGGGLAQTRSIFRLVMFRFHSKRRPFKIKSASHQVCSGELVLVEFWDGWSRGRRREVRGGGCDRAEVLCDVRQLYVTLWDKQREYRDHLLIFRASLSGLSDRLNHQQSGMWVNSGTVGR